MRWVAMIIAAAAVLVVGEARADTAYGRGETEHVGADMHPAERAEPGKTKKPWEVEAVWETHRLVRQNDLESDAVNKTVNVGFLYGRWDITKNNRVWVRGGFYQRFIADDQETGLRFDDAVAAYVRRVPLPEKFTFYAAAQLSAPASFDSQKESLITEPRVTLTLDKKLGRFLFVGKTYGGVHIMKYATAEGGNPNPRWIWVSMLAAEYNFPVVDMLTLGASVTNQYLWLYTPNYVSNAPNSQRYGVASDPRYDNEGQKVQQAYAAEVYLRYEIPELAGFKSNVTLSYAQGDPSLGYTSALHDGARHVYPLFWRHSSAVYGAFTVTY